MTLIALADSLASKEYSIYTERRKPTLKVILAITKAWVKDASEIYFS
jgi:hypothetical protein